MNASKLINVLRNHSAGCDGCGHEHNCNHSHCALMLQAAGALESLLAEVKQLKKQGGLMARYIVEHGNVDMSLCDDIPNELHLKYQPKNDGNYENEPCAQCVKEYFEQQAKEKKKA